MFHKLMCFIGIHWYDITSEVSEETWEQFSTYIKNNEPVPKFKFDWSWTCVHCNKKVIKKHYHEV